MSGHANVTAAPTADAEPRTGADLFEHVARLIAELERHPDPAVGERVGELLAGIDAVHRTALTHLFAAVQGLAGDTFINRLTADPAIRLLFMSYDLLAVDRRLLTEEALDAVRGHLHAHGVDVELLDVAGSEVFVRLHGADSASIPLDAVRHDLEAALRAGPVGFEVLTIGERSPTQSPPALVQLGARRGVMRPVYRSVLAAAELPPGEIRGVEVDDRQLLVANADGELYALANQCGGSPLPLHYGTLDGATLVCSWHGCRYDLRTGARLDDPGADRLAVFPVRVENGAVAIAVGVESVAPVSDTGAAP